MQRSKIGLLLAAAAAYGVYRYSRMTPNQKLKLKNQGKSFVDKNLIGITHLFGKKKPVANTNSY
jgi:hypothetical protein